MADDKSKTDRDRARVAGGQDYEVVEYLVKQAGITPDQARELIKRYGNDREVLLQHAKNPV